MKTTDIHLHLADAKVIPARNPAPIMTQHWKQKKEDLMQQIAGPSQPAPSVLGKLRIYEDIRPT